MQVMNEPSMGRRLRAARALAGVGVDGLARLLDTNGLSVRTLRKIENGERPLRPMERREIARVLGIADEFFEADFRRSWAKQ